MSCQGSVRQNGRKSIWVFGIVDPATEWSIASQHREANPANLLGFSIACSLGPMLVYAIAFTAAATLQDRYRAR
jgi:hypothetical protein